jgi:Kdo2-lipid IVA lauroyltransferase/acyltransferase
VKDLLWLVYLFPARLLAGLLGPRVLYALGRMAEPLFQWSVRKQRREARRRMQLAFGASFTPDEIEDLLRRFVANAIPRAVDDLCLAQPDAVKRMPPPHVEGLDYLRAALAAGRGVLLLSGHFYANRVAKSHLRSMGFPVLTLRNAVPSDRWMGRLGESAIQRRYLEFLHGVMGELVFIQDPQCALKIFRRLREGGMVNALFDAAFSSHALEAPFLGSRKAFATGLLEIARLSGCAVVPMLCTGNQRHCRIEFREALPMQAAANRQEYAAANLTRLVAILEEMIRRQPDEYELWSRL